MKFPVTVVFLSALLAPAAALGDDRIKVPGDNPLYHCPGGVAGDEVKITSVNLAPNPPAMYDPTLSPAFSRDD